MAGPAGLHACKKGEEAAGSTNFYTDEKLVFSAVSTGIRTGRAVVILTKEEDIQEQFYQLLWLLDTHYHSMLLAKAYVSEPSRFTTRPMPMDDRFFAEFFTGDGNLLIEGALDMRDALLPTSFTRVALHCFVMGPLLTRMSFLAEMQMAELLDVKAEMGGLNTNLLGGRNAHFWLGAMPLRPRYQGFGAVAHEERNGPAGSRATMSLLEVNQAIYARQPFWGLLRSPLL